ncbi:MAG: hypothetical protein EBS53_17840, partial [Bacteroidetes bacterium]|nr:hypothetical protein [Bacteroidota bacterium]
NADPTPITPIPLNGSGNRTYSQNFDGLGANTVAGILPGTHGAAVSLGAITSSNLNGWYGAKIAGNNTSAADFLVSDGTTNAGTLYNFGAVGGTNRALGAIANSGNTMAFGALITNTTGGTITNVKVSFTAEFWRNAIPSTSTSSAETNVLVFGYGKIDGTSNTVTNFLIASNALGQTNLNITGPAPLAFGTTPVNLDGNSTNNQVAFSSVSLGLVLLAGETAFLRWQDKDNTGNDAGLAIDDFVLTYDVDTRPMMTSFSPAVGQEGAQVTIRGANFTVGIPVKFNGIAASLVSVVSPTELAVTVPSGATTGYITIGEEGAQVASGTAFVVGNFSGDPTTSGTNFGNVSLGNVADKYILLNGGGLPGPTLDLAFDQPDFSLSEDGNAFVSTLSVSLTDGSVSYVFPALRFAPTSTGVKTAV